MRTLILTTLITIALLGAPQVFAADSANFVPIAPIPGANGAGSTSGDLTQYINNLFNLALGIGALLAVLMIVYGGFEYIFSGVMEGKKDGRARITQALYGLGILLLVYIILYIINPQIVSLNLF